MGGRRDLKSVPAHLRDSKEQGGDPDLYNYLLDLQHAQADGVPAGAGTTTPSTVQADDTGDVGTESLGWAPIDHEHAVETGSATGLANANAEGSGTALARANHTHKRDVRVALGGVDVSTRNRLNFVDSAQIDFQVTDDSGSDEVDVTAAFVAGALNHALLSATHTDTLPAAVTRGALVVGNSTPAWARLAIGANATFLRSDGTDAAWTAIAYSDLPSSAQHWTKTGAIVHLTTATDEVSVGDASAIDISLNKMEVLFGIAAKRYSATAEEAPIFASYRARGSFGAETAVQSADTLSAQNFYGNSGITSGYGLAASIRAIAKITFNGTDFNTWLEVWTGSTGREAEGIAAFTDSATLRVGGGYGNISTDLASVQGAPGSGSSLAGLASFIFQANDSDLAGALLIRSRGDTDPGAGFGTHISFRLEGADLSLVDAIRIGGIWEGAQSNDTTARDSALKFSTMLNNSIAEAGRFDSNGSLLLGGTTSDANYRLVITGATKSAGDIDPEADNTRDLGASTLRWNDAWATFVRAGAADNSGDGSLTGARHDGNPQLTLESAADNQFIMPFQRNWRARGSIASPATMSAGDYMYLFDAYGYKSSYELAARMIVDAESITTKVGGRIQWQTQQDVMSGAITTRFVITGAGNVIVGNLSGALATTATDGFLYIPSCAGTPTGVPTAVTGVVPLVYDSTNNILYVRSGGSWRAH